MQQVLFGGEICASPSAAADAVAALGLPPPRDLPRCNSLVNVLGCHAARGWLLLTRRSLNRIDLNDLNDLELRDDIGNRVFARDLVVTKEPLCVSPTWFAGDEEDPDALYLVDVADCRWLVRNPNYQVPLEAYYNARQPGTAGTFYSDTRNGGSDWTWQTLVTNLWAQMTAQLGTTSSATLPFTPTGTPEGWSFPGVVAWDALCCVLEHVGCAVRWDPSKTVSQGAYSVVRVGAAHAATDAILARAERLPRKEFDRRYLPVTRGLVPAGARVYFNRGGIYSSTDWHTGAVYSVDVANPVATGDEEAGVYTPLWDDLSAVYDSGGSLTNGSALNARAAERAADYFRRVQTGGGRDFRTFAGLVNVAPTGTVKAVVWRTDGQEAPGLVTDVMNAPDPIDPAQAVGCGECCEVACASTAARPPGMGVFYVSVVPDLTITTLSVDALTVSTSVTLDSATITVDTGDTLTIASGGTFTIANGSTVTITVSTGDTITLNSGATLDINSGTTVTIDSATFETLIALDSATIEVNAGDKIDIQNTGTLEIDAGAVVTIAADVSITDGTWTISGDVAYVWDSTGIFSFTDGKLVFNTTTNGGTQPDGYLVIPFYDFAGKPGWAGEPGEIGCGSDGKLWQWNDSTGDWGYYPVIDGDATPSDGDVLTYDSGTDTYTHTDPADLGGGGPAWEKYSITVVDVAGTKKFRVTDPDGGTTDTACAAATTQTLTLVSPAAGTTLTQLKWTVPTAFTGPSGTAASLGYSGGDGTASNTTAYVTTGGIVMTLAATRPKSRLENDFSNEIDACPHQTSAWNLTITITTTIGNLSTLDATGTLNLWFLLGLAA